MAYNKKNRLKRIIDIQNIYLHHSERGVSNEFIYNEYIYPVYKISIRTFYNYLAINAKREIKITEEQERQQLSLFDKNE